MKETIVKFNRTKNWFMVRWEDKQNWQTFSHTHQEKKWEESYQQNQKCKRRGYNRQCRNIKDYKRLLWTMAWQGNG